MAGALTFHSDASGKIVFGKDASYLTIEDLADGSVKATFVGGETVARHISPDDIAQHRTIELIGPLALQVRQLKGGLGHTLLIHGNAVELPSLEDLSPALRFMSGNFARAWSAVARKLMNGVVDEDDLAAALTLAKSAPGGPLARAGLRLIAGGTTTSADRCSAG